MLHEGKVVLITGGASPFGSAAALAFAREGARVAVADITASRAAMTVAAINAAGGEASLIEVDMLDQDSILQMVASTIAQYGGLDVAFNYADHRGGATNLVDCEEDEWELVMLLNLKAVWLSMKFEISEMLKCGGGTIINVFSSVTNHAWPNFASYVTTTTGLLGLTRSAAVDFGPAGIRVNALQPSFLGPLGLRPNMREKAPRSSLGISSIPLRRFSLAEEQAEAAVWLTSERASFITGACLVVDGGASALHPI